MDSRDKDEAKFQRQETLARRIGKALDEKHSRSAGDCPDGEILAAYAERGLGDEESAKWEGHFATCSRCRKILLVLNASADTPLAEREVARLRKLAAVTEPRAEAKPPASALAWPRFSDWRLRWLAPALGLAAALAVFVVLRANWRRAGGGISQVLVAQIPKEELPQSPAPSAPPPASRAERQQPLRDEQAGHLSSSNELNAAPPAVTPDTFAKRKTEPSASSNAPSAGANDEAVAAQAEKKLGALQAGREIQPRPAPAPLSNAAAAEVSPAVPSAPLPPANPAAPKVPAPEAAQLDAAGNAASAPLPGAKQAVKAQSAVGALPRAQASSEARPMLKKEQALALAAPVQRAAILKAPSGSTLWRAGSGGKIERSTDSGATWVQQLSPSQGDWLGGAAVSDAVCWLVGRHGAIARTADGQRWDLVPPPLTAAGADGVLPDWTSIVASDSRTATITANDGRRFMTADGGKTWQPQPTK